MTLDITTRPQYLNARTNIYTAWDLRSIYEKILGPGVAGYEDMRVLARQAGANMSVDIGKTGVGLMEAFVRGTTRGGQGLYRIDNIDRDFPAADTYLAQLNHAISANASGNPRLDQVILRVGDQQHAGVDNKAYIDVLAGTPTAGATLDNRNGAAALPASSILLADVIVANAETTIDAVDIRDRRAFALEGVVPPLLTDVNLVHFEAPFLEMARKGAYVNAGPDDLHQHAVLVHLPQRIVSATRIRWQYLHLATAMTGNYVLAIYDASGRKIVDTGSVAFTGAANSIQTRSETITATTFEAGSYYVLLGLDTSGTGGITGLVWYPTSDGGLAFPNVALRSLTGGVTAPDTLLSMTELLTAGAGIVAAVPVIGLSVG